MAIVAVPVAIVPFGHTHFRYIYSSLPPVVAFPYQKCRCGLVGDGYTEAVGVKLLGQQAPTFIISLDEAAPVRLIYKTTMATTAGWKSNFGLLEMCSMWSRRRKEMSKERCACATSLNDAKGCERQTR